MDTIVLLIEVSFVECHLEYIKMGQEKCPL